MSIKIMLIDDDPVARIYLNEALSMKGFLVTVFDSGEPAIKFASENEFDIAIIDTYMPGMSGIDVMSKLNELSLLKKNKVIIMSADIDCFELLSRANLIADKVLIKPIKIGTLISAISELFPDKQ